MDNSSNWKLSSVPPTSKGTFVEDKTCRICGTVDLKNVNIFDAKQKALLYKILTIFPITMYESDPLPKNICKKCSVNVLNMHDECQRLVKIQQKWIERVRVNQPGHPYVRVLNIIEECHQNMLTRIKQIAPDFIYKNIRLLPFEESNDNDHFDATSLLQTSLSQSAENLNDYQESPPKSLGLNSFSFDFDAGPVSAGNDSNSSHLTEDQTTAAAATAGNNQRSAIKELQHKLESNGCSLLAFKASQQNDVKPKLPKNRVLLTVDCHYCGMRFPNEKFLAKHQLMHMTVSDRRIFDRKCLDKGVRRGRLIPVDDKKCIRCLNCWKLFEDNRKILEHWSNAECEFFCQICGIEFARNPKQLREHVLSVHGITYKSSRRQVANLPEVRILNKPQPIDTKPTLPLLTPKPQPKSHPAPPPSKKSKLTFTANGRVSCNLCDCTFPNYQSKNSHMRVHRKQGVFQQKLVMKPHFDNRMPSLVVPVVVKTEKNHGYEDESAVNTNTVNTSQEFSLDASMIETQIKTEKVDDRMEAEPSNVVPASTLKISCVTTAQEPLQQSARPKPLETIKKPTTTSNANNASNVQAGTAKKPDQDHMQYDKMYHCHPCGKKFTSKTDLFQHKRLCQSNNKFGCRFCLRAFVTSADLQMHIMLMHKGS